MRSLIILDNPRLSQAFIDYMACQKVDVKMMPSSDGRIELWLVDDSQYERVRPELERFLEEPTHSRYAQASWQRSDTRNVPFQYRSTNFWHLIRDQAGFVTLAIMLSSLVIYGLNIIGFGQEVFNWVHAPAVVEQKWQIWRWITPALFHFSAIHIVFNLLWWWQLGGNIEKQLGPSKLMLIFLASAALSNVGQYWVDGPSFGGLSGVVYALVGYIWIVGWQRPDLGVSLSRPVIGFMLVWLVIGYVQPIMAIANTAHLVGLICGILLALIETHLLQPKH
ncbi:rhomboid family intramembrane serine protease GlpG [Vibrio sp. RC27]